MIKEKKKNKIITFLCACLMVCASALGLVQAVGTTLASSPTEPVITTDYLNYKNPNFLSYYYGAFGSINTVTSATQISFDYVPLETVIVSFIVPVDTFKFYRIVDGVPTLYTNYVSGVAIQTQTVLGSTYYKVNINHNATTETLVGKMNDFILVVNYNNLYYTFCPYYLYNRYLGYTEGLADADTSSAYNSGYNAGLQDGYTDGYGEGELEGYENGYIEGQDFGYTQGINAVLNNPNNYGLYTEQQYQQNYTDGYNAGLTSGYNSGYSDGQQASDAYQNGYNVGYTDGSNDVLNNPNNYGLYTQAQYEQNYTDGYNKGLTYARYGIYADITPIVKYGNVSANTVINEPFVYYLNGLIFSDNVMSLFPQGNYESGIMTVEINFNNDFVYTNDDFLKFFLPQTRLASIEYNLIDNNDNVYTYVASVQTTGSTSEDRETVFTNVPKSVDGSYVTGPVPSGSIIKTLEFTLINPNYYSLIDVYLHQLDNGYDLGYTTGYGQGFNNGVIVGGNESYQVGYNKGSVDGFNSGYSQGLANQDNATFASMISAVIDVPINAMRNLFNFDLLGINLFGFFTALFTLLVVITIIRLILGGK